MTISAVIPAAGIGKRFAAEQKKQFYELDSRPVLYYTFKALADSYKFTEFVVGAAPEDFPFIMSVAKDAGVSGLVLAEGGTERADTVFNAVTAAHGDYVLVHDAVRPFISQAIVEAVISTAIEAGGSICGLYSRDTVKRVQNSMITETIAREEIFLAHTPQVFAREKLINAMIDARQAGKSFTDEAAVFEFAGYPVKVVESSPDNIKITTQADLAIVQSLINKYFNK